MKVRIKAHDLKGWLRKWQKENREKEKPKKRKTKVIKNRWPIHKRREILRVLENTHCENTLTSKAIHGLVIPEYEDNQTDQWVTTRSLIYEARELHRVPIIFNSKGHFIARTQEDIDNYTRSMRSNAFTRFKSVRRIEIFFEGYNKPARVLKRRTK